MDAALEVKADRIVVEIASGEQSQLNLGRPLMNLQGNHRNCMFF
jgi:hypothetical protein